MIPDCTLVTACFDLTKCNQKSRNLCESIENMRSLLETPCYLVIFIDHILYNFIYEIRSKIGLDHLTKYIIKDFSELNIYKYVDTVKSNRQLYHPTKDERTSAESHLICCSKFDFVLDVINTNPFNTSKFGWIDSNIGKNFSKICINYKNNMLLKILSNATDKFHIQILNVTDKKYINPENFKEYYDQYRWVVCGSFFLTGKEIGLKILNHLNSVFINTTKLGYGHGEEMFYLEILEKYYDDIIRSYGDYGHILNNFININIGIDYILNLIIKNYLNYGYYRECYDCCFKILNSIENNDEIDYSSYFLILFYSYIALYYFDKQKAKVIKSNILKLIQDNPFINLEYNKNKNFYDCQFKFIN